VAHQLAQEALSIPIYPELTREMQDVVVAAIAEFLTEG
jgi:dTDP-4-amino-4,6-dideoxygalactose transaminase